MKALALYREAEQMISAEQNELMTRIGPGTPAGKLLRRYWQPVALVDEMQGERPVKAVRLLGEDLVLFKNQNQYGLHRAPLPASRRRPRLRPARARRPALLASTAGSSTRAASASRRRPSRRAAACASTSRQRAYPVGREERHPLRLPRRRRARRRSRTSTASSRPTRTRSPSRATGTATGCRRSRSASIRRTPRGCTSSSRTRIRPRATAGSSAACRRTPTCRSARCCASTTGPRSASSAPNTACACRRCGRISDAQTHIRVTNILFPQAFVIPMNAEMTISQWHVPVDDYRLLLVLDLHQLRRAGRQGHHARQRLKTYPAPDYKPDFHREQMPGASTPTSSGRKTFTGMGFDINIHDQWACESQGRIADRTKENLGTHRQGHRALPPPAARRDPQERGRREAADGARCAGRARDHRAAGDRRHRAHAIAWTNTGRTPTRSAASKSAWG